MKADADAKVTADAKAKAENEKQIKVEDLRRAVDFNSFKSKPEQIDLIVISEKRRGDSRPHFEGADVLRLEIEKEGEVKDSDEDPYLLKVRKSALQEWSIYYVKNVNFRPESEKGLSLDEKQFESGEVQTGLDEERSALEKPKPYDKVGTFKISGAGIIYFEDDSSDLNRREEAFLKLSKSVLKVICNDNSIYSQSLRSPELLSVVVELKGNELKSIFSAVDNQPENFPWAKINPEELKKIVEGANVEIKEKGAVELTLELGGDSTEKYADLKPYLPSLVMKIDYGTQSYRFFLVHAAAQSNRYEGKPPTSETIFEVMTGVQGFSNLIKIKENDIKKRFPKNQVKIEEDKDIIDLKRLKGLADDAEDDGYSPVEVGLKKFFRNPICFPAESRRLYLFVELEDLRGQKYWDHEKMKEWYGEFLKNNRKEGN